MFLKNSQNTRAFTLMELLIVIAIIAILTSIVLANLNSARTKARNVKAVESIKQLMTGMMLYYDTHGKFPCHTYQESKNAAGVENTNFMTPLFDQGFAHREVVENHTYPIEYATFSDNGPDCGQYAYIGFYTEGDSIICPYGVGHSHIAGGRPHCHQILPNPAYSCPDPYWINTSCPHISEDTVNDY